MKLELMNEFLLSLGAAFGVLLLAACAVVSSWDQVVVSLLPVVVVVIVIIGENPGRGSSEYEI